MSPDAKRRQRAAGGGSGQPTVNAASQNKNRDASFHRSRIPLQHVLENHHMHTCSVAIRPVFSRPLPGDEYLLDNETFNLAQAVTGWSGK